ncbi:Nif3-like dinuclear metal center hexameric protein [Desulfovibrio litoralis]|uniref:GTP cyclohydrolase 1 type 2 homolog n=1 Tax=Desulfovibrio litoralis DSM 11393 TaxID=1121455 RepID=A0A1M7S8C8_9BACT|nr:Nif3-like dinuclear metal center hexameric protein [Desulfovibrio litoralis]SHN54741.1 dinuclear metal center protein, YbgI/SA1388 family [Desulfovibrio litoralis DSM 11393]
MYYQDLIRHIEKTANPLWAAAWDNSGLQLVAKNQEIKKVALCLDPSPIQIQRAIEQNVQFILSHHPLYLKSFSLTENNLIVESLRLLFPNDLWLYSAHTSLDTNLQGPVSWLAEELKLKNVKVLEKTNSEAEFEKGFGFIGDLPYTLDFEAFSILLSKLLDIDAFSFCGNIPKNINKIACLPGSGASAVELAISSQADVFITGDVKYHAACDLKSRLELERQNGLKQDFCVIDVGHFSLEEEMMRRWTYRLASDIPELEFIFLESKNPLEYNKINLLRR